MTERRKARKQIALQGSKLRAFENAVRLGYAELALVNEGGDCCSIKGTKKLWRRERTQSIARIWRLRLLGKCHSDQARAQQDKTCNGHSEETVRGEFFTHGTPPIARECWLRLDLSRVRREEDDCQAAQSKKFRPGSDDPNLPDAFEQQRPVIRTRRGEGENGNRTAVLRPCCVNQSD
jgi:hypothetical protein